MSLYYFNFTDGHSIDDQVGTDLCDVRAAKVEAVNLLSAMLQTRGSGFWSQDDWKIEVQDEAHLTMFSIHVTGFDAPALMKPPRPT